MWGKTAAAIGIACAIAAGGAAVAAEMSAWPETTAMLAAPADEAAVFAFVERAETEGEYAAAANALERYLRFHPDDQRALSQIADLYDQMELGARAESFRERLPGSGEEPKFEVSGFVSVGGGYDTNPASAPIGNRISLFSTAQNRVVDIPNFLNSEGSFLGTAAFGVDVRAAETAELPALLLEVNGDAAFYEGVDDLEEYGASVRFGPELTLENGDVRPFIGASADWFDHDPYAVAGELGVTWRVAAGQTLITLEGAAGWSEYFDTVAATSRDDLDGVTAHLSGSAIGELDENLFGFAGLTVFGRGADEDFESHIGVTLSGALIRQFPEDGDIPALTLTLGAAATGQFHGGPDPNIDPNRTRRDLALVGFGTLSAEVFEDASVDFSLSYRRRFSSYNIFESDGVRAAVQFVRRF